MTQTATKYREIRLPDVFTSSDESGRRYGGDIRIGDLTGNGTVDFVVFQSLGGIKPAFLGAFDIDGEPLWSIGRRDLADPSVRVATGYIAIIHGVSLRKPAHAGGWQCTVDQWPTPAGPQ